MNKVKGNALIEYVVVFSAFVLIGLGSANLLSEDSLFNMFKKGYDNNSKNFNETLINLDYIPNENPTNK